MYKRLLNVFLFALRSGLIPAFNVLVSMLVVRLYSEQLWGSFVKEYMWVTLAASLLSWGNKDFLLRTFSQNPAEISTNWQIAWSARALLLPLVWLFFLLKYQSFFFSIELLIWTCGLFFFQSYEVIILYEKDFEKMIAVEMTGFLLILGSIFAWGKGLETADLRLIFIVSNILKVLILCVLYQKNYPLRWKIEGTKNFLHKAFPFLLISISGLLNSRADTYTASISLTEKDLGRYQILMNFILYVQSISALVLTPFIKNIYRLPAKSFQKLLIRFSILGFCISLLFLPFFWLIFHYFYLFSWEISHYIAMFLLCFPMFGISPLVYRMYKMGKERKVIYLNFGGTIFLVLICLFTMPHYGIAGGLWAAVITQWLTWATYLGLQFHKKSNN